jgi:hypothetical protein
MTRINGFLVILLGTLPLLAAACDTEEELLPEDFIDVDTDDNIGEDADEDDEFRAWTGYTSEETPPIICPNYYAARGFDCTGSYCDNVAIYCQYVGGSYGQSSWTTYFSEEGSGGADERHCSGSDSWVTGVACSGSYCDDLSLRCTRFPGTSTGSCYWSGSFSEEQPPFYAPYGYYIKGMECIGSYCDDKQYRYCQMN